MCGTFDSKEVFTVENLKDFEYVSYPYPKYGETVLAVKLGNGNAQVLNVSDHLAEGLYNGYLEHKEFCEAFAKRIEVCLNKFVGKTLEEIERKN